MPCSFSWFRSCRLLVQYRAPEMPAPAHITGRTGPPWQRGEATWYALSTARVNGKRDTRSCRYHPYTSYHSTWGKGPIKANFTLIQRALGTPASVFGVLQNSTKWSRISYMETLSQQKNIQVFTLINTFLYLVFKALFFSRSDSLTHNRVASAATSRLHSSPVRKGTETPKNFMYLLSLTTSKPQQSLNDTYVLVYIF